MTEQKLTSAELTDGVEFDANASHRITLLSATRLRLVGFFFDLDKCFLLPTAVPGLKRLTKQYKAHPEAHLLVVGHTDTSGRDAYNLTLSLERADAVAAYLTDDASKWQAFFGADKPEEKRWGTLEVQYMLSVLPEDGPPFFAGEPNGEKDAATTQAIKDYQKKSDLAVDGIAGPDTQAALIRDYMALDGTTLPDGTSLTTHGCGENFPIDDTGDDVQDPDNRRVEIFFFDGPIEPPPPGKTSARGSTEYPRWLAQVEETVDVGTGGVTGDVLRLRIHADPDQVIHIDDQFRLFDDDGFEQILDMPEDADEDSEFVDLTFTNVPTDSVFSLEVLCPDDEDYLLLDHVPFGDISAQSADAGDVETIDPQELEPGPDDDDDTSGGEVVAGLEPDEDEQDSADGDEEDAADGADEDAADGDEAVA